MSLRWCWTARRRKRARFICDPPKATDLSQIDFVAFKLISREEAHDRARKFNTSIPRSAEKDLPISAHARQPLLGYLQSRRVIGSTSPTLRVVNVFLNDYDGNIMCQFTIEGGESTCIFVAPLTQLALSRKHPAARESAKVIAPSQRRFGAARPPYYVMQSLIKATFSLSIISHDDSMVTKARRTYHRSPNVGNHPVDGGRARARRRGRDLRSSHLTGSAARRSTNGWRRSRNQGFGSVRLRRGRTTGRPRSLTARQERRRIRWINGNDPRQYGLGFWATDPKGGG